MSDSSRGSAVPTGIPILSRGKHRNPVQGACFMEYTSLLAGEAFTDQPRCVDDELAAVMRGANDKLSDADRPLLASMLGRGIGLAIEPPPSVGRWRVPAPVRKQHRALEARHRAATSQLRRAVAVRYGRALGVAPTRIMSLWSGWGEELSWLFWDLMSDPPVPRRHEDYVNLLVDRLNLLHECYEQAMDELGLPRPGGTVDSTADQRTAQPMR
jgi:hypothetical protein